MILAQFGKTHSKEFSFIPSGAGCGITRMAFLFIFSMHFFFFWFGTSSCNATVLNNQNLTASNQAIRHTDFPVWAACLCAFYQNVCRNCSLPWLAG